MALEAQGADIGQIAFPAAFDDRKDVIGIPQASAEAAAEAPVEEGLMTRETTQPHDTPPFSHAVHAADGADAPVAIENLLPEIARIGPEPPFLDTVIGAERAPAFGNLKTAPAAEAPAIRSGGERVAHCAAPGHDARGAHVETF